MSPNAELVRSIYEAWERSDFSSYEWAHPEIEYVAADGAETGQAGLAGVAEGVREFLTAWEGFRIVADEYRELDEQRVLVIDHRGGRSKTSGLDLAHMRTQGARLFYIQGGKVTRLVTYLDRDRAFADLGISSHGEH